MNLKKLGKNTYVMIDQTNIGFYTYNENSVVIIDTGFTAQKGEEIAQICKEYGWQIKMIINTHGHPDHIGGNKYLQDKYNIPIYANKTECTLIENPLILSSISYGGYPYKKLLNPNIMAQASTSQQIADDALPSGLSFFPLPGHNQDMIGLKTDDDVYFLGDALIGRDLLSKFKVQFTFDLSKNFETLDLLKSLKGKYFIPSHGNVHEHIQELITTNENNIKEMINLIKSVCINGLPFDEIMKSLFDNFHMNMNAFQYNIVSATIKCYLTYMIDNGLIKHEVKDNILLWKTT